MKRLTKFTLLTAFILGMLVACTNDSSSPVVTPTTTQVSSVNISTPLSQAKCPITTNPGGAVSPDFGKAFGQGPVYVVFGVEGVQTGGPVYYGNAGSIEGKKAIKTLWVADPSYKGPINIKGRQMDGLNQLSFKSDKVTKELQFSSEAGGNGGITPTGWSHWPTGTLIPAPGCYAYEVEGRGFSYPIIFQAVDTPAPVTTPATTSSVLPATASTLVATTTLPATTSFPATSVTQPTLEPATLTIAATPSLPVVEDIMGILPINCQISKLSYKKVAERFPYMAGGPVVGFAGPNEAIVELGYGGQSLASSKQIVKQYGWATKILWIKEPDQKEPVTLSWRNQADGTPAWFHFSSGASMNGSDFTTTPILDPNLSTSYIDSPSNVFFPKAGCYTLEANWKGGNWKLTFAVGRPA